jgi:hypothetical protein
MVFEDSLGSRALQDRHRICLDCDGLAEFRVKESTAESAESGEVTGGSDVEDGKF